MFGTSQGTEEIKRLIEMKGLILNIVSCFVVGITAHGGILSYNIAGTNYMAYVLLLPPPTYHISLLPTL
jgi:hypothetical protein